MIRTARVGARREIHEQTLGPTDVSRNDEMQNAKPFHESVTYTTLGPSLYSCAESQAKLQVRAAPMKQPFTA